MDSSTGGVELWLCVVMTLFLPYSLSLSYECPMLFKGTAENCVNFLMSEGNAALSPHTTPALACIAGDWTCGLVCGRQIIYHWAMFTGIFLFLSISHVLFLHSLTYRLLYPLVHFFHPSSWGVSKGRSHFAHTGNGAGMKDAAAVLVVLRGSSGHSYPIWTALHSTCCLFPSDLHESEPGCRLHQDFQSFKVNRIFLMIWTLQRSQFGWERTWEHLLCYWPDTCF